ncbi:MAG: DUF5056 domain-containing protein [Prevotella sp.]|nr:DUF5056 domain-containing protein [Prevotella sp.]
MTDKDNIMIEEFFKQAAQQQIEDNGFTERVMQNLPVTTVSKSRRLSHLWTLFCLVIGVALFFAFGGMQLMKVAMTGLLQMVLTALEVFVVTSPTTEIPVNPWLVLLVLGFVLIYLPYQTGRKLSSIL